MKTTTKLLIICIVVILNGCVTAEKCQTKFPCLQKDTTIETITKHDTVVYIEPDIANWNAYIECDSFGRVLLDSIKTLQGKRIVVRYVLQDHWLRVDCKEDKSPFYITYYNREIYKLCNKIQMMKPEKESFLHQLRLPLILILAIILSLLLFRIVKK
jgi:hypothetical protein